jgi:hypothetical protein
MTRRHLATLERHHHAKWPRSAGKNHAFCRPHNEATALVREKRRRRLFAN